MNKNPVDEVFVVSRAEQGNSVTLHDIAVETNIDAWTPEDYSDEIGRDDSIVLKAENGSARIVGFLVARTVSGSVSGIDADLYNIAVLKAFRGQGIGAKLMAALQNDLKEKEVQYVWLEVRSSNSPAIHFYEKHGFEMLSTRRNFYSNPMEDAIIMRLECPKNN